MVFLGETKKSRFSQPHTNALPVLGRDELYAKASPYFLRHTLNSPHVVVKNGLLAATIPFGALVPSGRYVAMAGECCDNGCKVARIKKRPHQPARSFL